MASATPCGGIYIMGHSIWKPAVRKTAGGLALMVGLALAQPAAAQGASAQAAAPAPTTVVVHADKTPHKPSLWFRAESAHFVIYSDTSHDETRLVLNRLEALRALMGRMLNVDASKDDGRPKTEIDLMARRSDFDVVGPDAPDYAIGLYKSCEDDALGFGIHVNMAENHKLQFTEPSDSEEMTYLFAAYAKSYIQSHVLDRQPSWFIDGLAYYFSTVTFDGASATVGLAPVPLARYVNFLDATMRDSLGYTQVLQQQETKGSSGAGESGLREEYEARSWVLVHYILSSPDNLSHFRAYMANLTSGQAPLAAWRAAFHMTPQQLDEKLWRYRMRKLQLTKVSLPAIDDDVSFEALPPSADHVLLWQSALRTCASDRYGPGLLKQVAGEAPKFPDSALAQLALSRAQVVWGDPAAAMPWLSQATTASSTDAQAFVLLGRAHLALARKATDADRADHLSAAVDALEKAQVLDPGSSVNAWYLYRARLARTGAPDLEAENAALKAWWNAPGVDTYALHAGLVYAYLGYKDKALQALRSVADNPHGRALSAVAKLWIDKIEQGVGQADLLAAMTADYPAPEGGLETWTLASSDLVQAVHDNEDGLDTPDGGVNDPSGDDASGSDNGN